MLAAAGRAQGAGQCPADFVLYVGSDAVAYLGRRAPGPYYVDVVDCARRDTPWHAAHHVCTLPAAALRTLRSNLTRGEPPVRAPVNIAFSSEPARCSTRPDPRLSPICSAIQLVARTCRCAFRRSFVGMALTPPIARHDVRGTTMMRARPLLRAAGRARTRVRRGGASDRFLAMMLEAVPGYGRAVAWGAKSAPTPPRVIGYQHSPINANQLVHRFAPDEVAPPDAAARNFIALPPAGPLPAAWGARPRHPPGRRVYVT